MGSKAAYVLSQGQTRDHHCHWPGCERQVPPAKWGCRQHWFALPKPLRDKIWRTYQPGQEISGTPSREYVAVAREVQAWIENKTSQKERPAPSSAVVELRLCWNAFTDGDPYPDGFLERMEEAGLASFRAVTEDDVQNISFSAERGIELGGHLWELTEAGHAAIRALVPNG